jgi:hypothetical protein
MFEKVFIFFLASSQVICNDILNTNDCLVKGDRLVSKNGCYQLEVTNNEFQIVKSSNCTAAWVVSLTNEQIGRACMGPFGNLFIENTAGIVRWETGSHMDHAYMQLMNDGNLVMKSYVWQTGPIANSDKSCSHLSETNFCS